MYSIFKLCRDRFAIFREPLPSSFSDNKDSNSNIEEGGTRYKESGSGVTSSEVLMQLGDSSPNSFKDHDSWNSIFDSLNEGSTIGVKKDDPRTISEDNTEKKESRPKANSSENLRNSLKSINQRLSDLDDHWERVERMLRPIEEGHKKIDREMIECRKYYVDEGIS